MQEKYITGSCTISNGMIHQNGQLVFENKDATLPDFLLSIYQHFAFSYTKFYKMDNLSKLGWLAAEILLRDNILHYGLEDTGVILANANASLDNDLKYLQTINDVASPSVFVYTLPNIVIGEICIRHHFKGEHAFYIQETFDAGFIVQQVNYLLENDILQACVCGWVDVLGKSYKAALFLIEKKAKGYPIVFCADNINYTFNNVY